jgi:hypothetical protein
MLLLLRPLSVGRFAFLRPKKWHTIFFTSKANFKIFPKLLRKPRRASPSLKNSPEGSSALSGVETMQ